MRYPKIDIMKLGLVGPYAEHISAMTGEQLHEKSDIAKQLSLRDAYITELELRIRNFEAVRGTMVDSHQVSPKHKDAYTRGYADCLADYDDKLEFVEPQLLRLNKLKTVLKGGNAVLPEEQS